LKRDVIAVAVAAFVVVSHGQKAVDPLKLVLVVDHLSLEKVVSHGQKAVDPLKHVIRLVLDLALQGLPRSEGRGPIEA